jgi:hypothetical protein
MAMAWQTPVGIVIQIFEFFSLTSPMGWAQLCWWCQWSQVVTKNTLISSRRPAASVWLHVIQLTSVLIQGFPGKLVPRYRQRDCNIYICREEIPNLRPTKTRALIFHCRLWGPSENKGTDSGTSKLHPSGYRASRQTRLSIPQGLYSASSVNVVNAFLNLLH